jgi:hypothetical protein
MKTLFALAASALVLGCAHSAPGVSSAACLPTYCGPHALRAAARVDRPATHGMLIVGSQTVYLSHLPMFHAPHDYQVIVEARFHAPKGDPQATYVADRAKTGTPIYTLVPEPFVLPDVIKGKRSFKATIFRGHFERGGTSIAENVTVDITRVLLFKPFDPQAVKPTDLQYFLFGKGPETFLAHLIVAPPDYDQVLAVKPGAPIPDGVQSAGMNVTIANHLNNKPLIAGEAATAGTLSLGVSTEFYKETGDLAN